MMFNGKLFSFLCETDFSKMVTAAVSEGMLRISNQEV